METRRSSYVSVPLFFFVGLLETVFSYVIFDRADDHAYFLSLANRGAAAVALSGIELQDLKAIIVGHVFYWLTAPSRLLGGHQLTHLLWLRLLTLAGFCFAFEWVRRASRADRFLSVWELNRARRWFLLVVLIYPGQLAWTSSLLRDGVACALLFLALYSWLTWSRLLGAVAMALAAALRPEFLVVVVFLFMFPLLLRAFRGARQNYKYFTVAICALIAVLSFDARQRAASFSQSAFADSGMAYPVVDSSSDLAGYAMVVAQALIDPVPLGSLSGSGLFQLAEAVFFLFLLGKGIASGGAWGQSRWVFVSILSSLWFFAYFEVFVSGFSRHRLGLVVLLAAYLALVSVRSVKRRSKRAVGSPVHGV